MSTTPRNFFRVGVNKQQPAYLQHKIITSNYLALIIFGIASFFLAFTLVYYPSVTWVPLVAVPICFSPLLLNRLGLVNASRLVISLLPSVLLSTYHAHFVPAGGHPILCFSLLQLSLTIIPFVVFDLRERGYLITSAGMAFLILVTFRFTNNWFDAPLDDSLVRGGLIEFILIPVAVLLAYVSITVLMNFTRQAEIKAENLVKEMDEKNHHLLLSERDLKGNLTQLHQAQQEEKQRNWITQGLADLSGRMRAQTDLQTGCDQLIASLVKYLDANQGAFYLVKREAEDTHLELVSCYAYQRKKFVQQTIAPGQGLVGQAYLEKDHIYLTEVPSDYLTITSGLGEASAKAVLIVPLLHNQAVEGLFELASFQAFAPHQIEFVRQLGENVAASLNSIQLNQTTRQLLEASQQQAEQMRAQEEEMRQNLEELNATQEEMLRKERAYLQRIAELEQCASSR